MLLIPAFSYSKAFTGFLFPAALRPLIGWQALSNQLFPTQTILIVLRAGPEHSYLRAWSPQLEFPLFTLLHVPTLLFKTQIMSCLHSKGRSWHFPFSPPRATRTKTILPRYRTSASVVSTVLKLRLTYNPLLPLPHVGSGLGHSPCSASLRIILKKYGSDFVACII